MCLPYAPFLKMLFCLNAYQALNPLNTIASGNAGHGG